MTALDLIVRKPPPNRRARSSRLAFGGCSIVLIVTAMLILYPLGLLVYGSFLVDQTGGRTVLGLAVWSSAWKQSGLVQAVVNTVERALVTEAISLPVAIFVAWLVARTDLPGKKLIDTFFWIAFFMPTLPVLLGWILLFNPDYGIVNAALLSWLGLARPPFDIYSFSGIVFAHLATRSISAKYIFLMPAFQNVDGSLEEASHIVGCGALATMRRILLPILLPVILITMIISLLHSLESFEIELILGPPMNFYVFSTEMYQLTRASPPLFGEATVLGLSVLVCMLPLILWQQRLISTRNFVTMGGRFQHRPLRLRRLRWPLFAGIALLVSVMSVVPTLCLVLGTSMNIFGHFELAQVWTTDHWREVLSDPELLHALSNTLTMGGGAALIGLVWFAVVAYISVRTRYAGRSMLDFITWLPATLPGIVLSLGMLWMFLTVPLFRPIYGTIFVLIIAVLINAVTTGVQLIKSNLVQVGFEMEEASFVLGAGWIYTFRRIVLPLVGPVLVSVALITFNAAARNIANIVMLGTGRNRPLALLQVDYMIDGQYEPAAIVGVIIVVLTLGVAWVARAIGRRFGFRTL